MDKRKEIIREVWSEDANGALSPEELREFVKALEHEGALADINRRRELLEAQNKLEEVRENQSLWYKIFNRIYRLSWPF